MPSTLRIDIQGRANVAPNVSRGDAQPGDVVSVLLTDPHATPQFELLWSPRGAGAGAVQTSGGETRYVFTVPAGAMGTYRFRYTDATGTDPVVREVAVRTPARGLRIPALGSKAAVDASLLTADAAHVAQSENNEVYAGDGRLAATSGANFTGYALDVEHLFRAVDQLGADVDALEAAPPGSVPQTLLDQVDDHGTRLNGAESAITAHDTRITTARAHADDALEQIVELDGRVAALESAPGGGEGGEGGEGENSLQDQILALDTRISALENAPGGITAAVYRGCGNHNASLSVQGAWHNVVTAVPAWVDEVQVNVSRVANEFTVALAGWYQVSADMTVYTQGIFYGFRLRMNGTTFVTREVYAGADTASTIGPSTISAPVYVPAGGKIRVEYFVSGVASNFTGQSSLGDEPQMSVTNVSLFRFAA